MFKTYPTFLYDDISTSKTIRLLRIDLSDKDTLNGQLCTIKLEDAPPYLALSYCWGSPKKDDSLWCNGSRIQITTSLSQALRRLADLQDGIPDYNHTEPWFWIDQICINQHNPTERSHQVRMMGEIYAQSYRTLIWLGLPNESCDQAWDLLDLIFCVFRRECPNALFLSDIKLQLYAPTHHATFGLPEPEDLAWAHLRHLLDAPWFRRTWVIQETVLSPKDPLILRNSGVYPWEKLSWAASWLRRTGFCRTDIVSQRFLNIDLLANLRRSVESWKLPALLQAVGPKFDATDPRDKVYGLLGLAAETKSLHAFPPALIPDYRRDVTEVYREVARYLIERYRCLAMFTCTIPGSENNIILDLVWWRPSRPIFSSWVPRWDVLIEKNQTRSLVWLSYRNGGRATEMGFPTHYASVGGLPTAIERCADHRCLRLKGFRVDTIASTSCISSNSAREKFQKQALNIALDSQGGSLDPASADAFIAAISANAWHLAGSNPQQLRRNGYAFLLSHLHNTSGLFGIRKHILHEAAGGDADAFVALAKNFAINRRFFVTKQGRLGLGPKWTKKGDVVSVLFGSGLPYILRPKGNTQFMLLGESYTHSLMNGESIEAWRSGRLKDQYLDLL
ncbi:hypothetical protein COCVIDRAFT_113339 [Bipolaris victoriae FI3]|uniref:Heterokaryon incompatibility domain-containing protein n=1 Tax=Bipolaris victoriae (strain FI3) TaxID=930091 RepID=W7E6V9_BIPV3|nr:hypothetical protein COCVIDRAFT_113339 [Bipolaris victoriae FI3]